MIFNLYSIFIYTMLYSVIFGDREPIVLNSRLILSGNYKPVGPEEKISEVLRI